MRPALLAVALLLLLPALASAKTVDVPSLFLIDLNDVRFGPPLGWRQSFDNLVILNRWFIMQAARSDRMRFLLGYLQARPLPLGLSRDMRDPLVRGWTRGLESATWKSLQRLWRHRDRRCRGHVRDLVAAG